MKITLKNKVNKKKRHVLEQPYGSKLFDKELYYLGNCIYWLKEFQKGTTDKKKALEVTAAIKGLANDIQNKVINYEKE